MRKWLINVLLGSVVVLASASDVQAAELQVIAGGGIAGPLNEIAALFECASGHKVVIRYGTTPELIKMATSGVPFDLGVVPQDVWKDAGARAHVAPGPMWCSAVFTAYFPATANRCSGTPNSTDWLLCGKSLARWLPREREGFRVGAHGRVLGTNPGNLYKIDV